MSKVPVVLCLLVVVGLSDAFPKSRSGYFPRSYMIGGSFYANPRYVREGPGYEYLPPGQMTAMVVGDTVATNSFSGPLDTPTRGVLSFPDVAQLDEDEIAERITEKQQPVLVAVPEPDVVNETEPEEFPEQPEKRVEGGEQEVLFSVEEATTEASATPTNKPAVVVAPTKVPAATRKGKVGKAKKPLPVAPPQPADEEEDEESDLPASWPFAGARKGGIPSYNAFFPIFIGGSSPSGRSRTRSTGEEAFPGSATAIANAFSTGKGGVATSHATSFGDPFAAAMMRNSGLFKFRTKANRKPVEQEEDEE